MRRFFLILLAASLLGAGVGLAERSPAGAHAPHDQATDIDYPANHEESGAVLAIVRGRLMRSVDRGQTWQEIVNGLGGEAQKLVMVDAADNDPLVAFAVGLDGTMFRSNDGGRSWEAGIGPADYAPRMLSIAPDDAATVVVAGAEAGLPGPVGVTADGGDTWTEGTLDGETLYALSVIHLGDDVVVAGGAAGRIYRSTDGGSTFAELDALSTAGRIGDFLSTVTEDGVELYVLDGTPGEIHRSTDLGDSFETLGDGLPAEVIRDVAFSPLQQDGQSELWAVATVSGAYRSRDNGATWSSVYDGLTITPQAQQVGGADFATVEIAPDGDGTALLGGFDGVFLLEPGADVWMAVETLTDYITGLSLSPNYAQDQTLIVFTYVRGAYLSTDGGASWAFVNDGLLRDSIDEGNRFAPIRRLHNVHFSPGFESDQTIFAANWVRLLRSDDAGGTWEEIPVGTPPEGSPLRQYVTAVSPSYETDHTLWVGTRQGELFVSTMRGDRDSWEQISQFEDRVRSIAPSPAVIDDETLYVGTVRGAFRSTDGGVTWTDTAVGNQSEVTGRETDFGVQVAISPNYAVDGMVLAGTDQGLYESRDFGASWALVTVGPFATPNPVEAVSFSPDFANDGLILVSSRGTGLVRSTDGGLTYSAVGAGLEEGNLLIADYANPSSAPIQFSPTYATDGVVFAYAQQELIRSTDAGSNWEIVDLPSIEMFLDSLPGAEPDPETTTTPPPVDGVTPGSDESSDDSSSALTIGLLTAGVAVVAGAAGVLRRRKR